MRQARRALAKLRVLLLGPKKAGSVTQALLRAAGRPPRRLSKAEVQELARAGRLPWNPAETRTDPEQHEDVDDVAERAQKRAIAAAAAAAAAAGGAGRGRKAKGLRVRPWDALGLDQHPARPSRPR